MRNTLRTASIAGVAALGLAMWQPAAADAAPYHFDETHTQVLFDIMHMGMSDIHGQFRKFDTKLNFNPDEPQKTSLTVTIDASSIDTNYGPRDEHLRGDAFFDVKKYPDIVFKSTKVEKTGADTAKLIGNLTMHGVTKPLTLDVKLVNHGPSFAPGTQVYGFSATGTIKRSEWGIKAFLPSNGKPGLADDVGVTIVSEVNNMPPMGPPPKSSK
jgi:polyisoprenoid-binding protein YceI